MDVISMLAKGKGKGKGKGKDVPPEGTQQ